MDKFLRTYSSLNGLGRELSLWRLDKAIKGESIKGHQALADVGAGALVEKLIDGLRWLELGLWLYDRLHPEENSVDENTNNLFLQARNWSPPRDPLVLDLNGDGVKNGNGNSLSATTTFTRSDGSTGIAGDLNLSNNSFYREFTDKIQISDEIAELPNMKGSGAVRDLREAAQLSPALAAKLSELVEAGNIDRSEFQAKIHGTKNLGALQKHGVYYI